MRLPGHLAGRGIMFLASLFVDLSVCLSGLVRSAREMADRPTEARAYGAHNTAPPLSKLLVYTGVSGDGFMDPTSSLGLLG